MCVLHVIGDAFDPLPVLARRSLKPYQVFRKGDKQFPDNPRSDKIHSNGGFSCGISDIENDLSGQIKDAIAFLKTHYGDLQQLAKVEAVESKYLDFGNFCRIDIHKPIQEQKCFAQYDRLPVELLKLCGDLGIAIELSLYPAND